MIKNNLNKINTILERKENNIFKIYTFAFIIISFLETMSVGLIPAFFTVILDTNLLLEQFKFNKQLYEFSKSLFEGGNIILFFAK